MNLLSKDSEYTWKAAMFHLVMIDINSDNKSVIVYTIGYPYKLASEHHMPALVTIDQLLLWKASV